MRGILGKQNIALISSALYNRNLTVEGGWLQSGSCCEMHSKLQQYFLHKIPHISELRWSYKYPFIQRMVAPSEIMALAGFVMIFPHLRYLIDQSVLGICSFCNNL